MGSRRWAGRPGRRSTTLALGIAVAALMVAGASSWALTRPRPSQVPATRSHHHARTSTTATTQPAGPSSVPIGVYAGPGAATTASAVDAQLGGRVGYALDFLDEASWATITQPDWLATAWRGAPFRLVLGIPMLPARGATLAQGATGAFDGEYSLLAERLVADGLGTSVLMVGWQPDDRGQPWYVASSATARHYVQYWDLIRSAMAAVPGAHFVFEWDAGDGGTSPVDPAAMYPGNAAVDLVATDAFDHLTTPGTGTRWQSVLDERYGPTWMVSFAATHHKPMALGMWGEIPRAAGGGGDDARFVRDLLSWASTAHLQICMLWDYGTWALTGGTFPAADAAFAHAFAGRSTATPATPAQGRPSS